jgi:hypothetical protein
MHLQLKEKYPNGHNAPTGEDTLAIKVSIGLNREVQVWRKRHTLVNGASFQVPWAIGELASVQKITNQVSDYSPSLPVLMPPFHDGVKFVSVWRIMPRSQISQMLAVLIRDDNGEPSSPSLHTIAPFAVIIVAAISDHLSPIPAAMERCRQLGNGKVNSHGGCSFSSDGRFEPNRARTDDANGWQDH